MINNSKLLALVISLVLSSSISAMEHSHTDKTVKMFTSKFKIPVGQVDFTDLYSTMSKISENEREAVQTFFNEVNSKIYTPLSNLTDNYASQIIDFDTFKKEVLDVVNILLNLIKTFNEVKISNPNLKKQLLFEYQRALAKVVKNFIATGEKINSILIDDLNPKKKTILRQYSYVQKLKSNL